MSEKMLMVDIDGVCADFTSAFTSLAVKLGVTDKIITPQEQTSWRFDFRVDPVWREIDKQPYWWITLGSLLKAEEIDALNELARRDKVCFITNRRTGKKHRWIAARQTQFWLAEQGVRIEPYRVLSTEGTCAKSMLAQLFKVEAAIDDNPETLEELKASGFTAVARRWKYNSEWRPSVADLGEFLEIYS